VKCPTAICLLMKLWEIDERFVPRDITNRMPLSARCVWRWNGMQDQSGDNIQVERWATWTKLDQQTVLENSVGKIFSEGSAHSKTVIQIHGTDVSVRHRKLGVVRRFSSQPDMLSNLFSALIKMVEVKWLPEYKSKDGKHYYTMGERDDADTKYNYVMLDSAVAKLPPLKPNVVLPKSVLDKNDPFYGSSMDMAT